MRIALAVDGTRGDVHPMLALGDRLRARATILGDAHGAPKFFERASSS